MAQHVNIPAALPSVPGFSEQQVHNLINIIHSVIQQYFAPPNQTTPAPIPSVETSPSSTPPTPQEAQKEEDEQLQKQEQQPLYQATMESITESTTKHGSSMPDSKSTISTISRLCTVRSSGDSAACLSNALLLACLFGYIGHPKGIEATGQG